MKLILDQINWMMDRINLITENSIQKKKCIYVIFLKNYCRIGFKHENPSFDDQCDPLPKDNATRHAIDRRRN